MPSGKNVICFIPCMLVFFVFPVNWHVISPTIMIYGTDVLNLNLKSLNDFFLLSAAKLFRVNCAT